jgi:hypothetical protein
MTTISLLDVQARWGYSEIFDSQFSHYYRGSDIPELREKRSNGIAFEDLKPGERYSLAFQCACVRAKLMPYFTGITTFEEIPLAREELNDLFVPPIVWGGDLVIRFSQYIKSKSDIPSDPRNVVANPSGYNRPTDPITIGRAYAVLYLVDGYHRAASFWRHNPTESLAAYTPESSACVASTAS